MGSVDWTCIFIFSRQILCWLSGPHSPWKGFRLYSTSKHKLCNANRYIPTLACHSQSPQCLQELRWFFRLFAQSKYCLLHSNLPLSPEFLLLTAKWLWRWLCAIHPNFSSTPCFSRLLSSSSRRPKATPQVSGIGPGSHQMIHPPQRAFFSGQLTMGKTGKHFTWRVRSELSENIKSSLLSSFHSWPGLSELLSLWPLSPGKGRCVRGELCETDGLC